MTRDEPEQTRLGLLDGVLEHLIFAAIAAEDDELQVEFSGTLRVSIEALVRDAVSLRAAARAQRSVELRTIEDRVESGDSSPELLADHVRRPGCCTRAARTDPTAARVRRRRDAVRAGAQT